MSTVKNDKLSIFIILDAFRWDYMNAEDTPTLTKLAEDGAYGHKLLSSSGFTQRSSIFTGTWPETTRNFTMFIYKPESSQYRYLRFFPFLKYFEFRVRKLDNLIRIILTKINRYFYRGRFFPPAYIPYEMLPLIGISEDNIPIFKPRAFGDIESLFDVFDRQDVKFEFLMHPLAAGNDDWVLKRLLATPLKNGVIFAQFSDSDAGIHVAGVGSQGAKDIIRDIDNRLKQICDEFDSRDQEYELILVGDHGMQNVQTRLDVHHHVSAALAEKGLTFSKDYLIFLSSTLTHFWWFNDDAECAIRELV
ncbi:MAG: alkaline phosphatase family protein, partial [Kiritimatiellae bacterium]|nr:alkaline phosphatase family protein [Kiritimatiellia bacterium]